MTFIKGLLAAKNKATSQVSPAAEEEGGGTEEGAEGTAPDDDSDEYEDEPEERVKEPGEDNFEPPFTGIFAQPFDIMVKGRESSGDDEEEEDEHVLGKIVARYELLCEKRFTLVDQGAVLIVLLCIAVWISNTFGPAYGYWFMIGVLFAFCGGLSSFLLLVDRSYIVGDANPAKDGQDGAEAVGLGESAVAAEESGEEGKPKELSAHLLKQGFELDPETMLVHRKWLKSTQAFASEGEDCDDAINFYGKEHTKGSYMLTWEAMMFKGIHSYRIMANDSYRDRLNALKEVEAEAKRKEAAERKELEETADWVPVGPTDELAPKTVVRVDRQGAEPPFEEHERAIIVAKVEEEVEAPRTAAQEATHADATPEAAEAPGGEDADLEAGKVEGGVPEAAARSTDAAGVDASKVEVVSWEVHFDADEEGVTQVVELERMLQMKVEGNGIIDRLTRMLDDQKQKHADKQKLKAEKNKAKIEKAQAKKQEKEAAAAGKKAEKDAAKKKKADDKETAKAAKKKEKEDAKAKAKEEKEAKKKEKEDAKAKAKEEKEGGASAEPTRVAATPEQLVKGTTVWAERGGEYEEAKTIGPSKKKENHWALKFASDGKVVPKPLDKIEVLAGGGSSAAGGDGDGGGEEDAAAPS